MSGSGNSTQLINNSSDATIAALIADRGWSGSVDYAFPTNVASYNPPAYDLPSITNGFQAINTTMENAARFFLEGTGNASAYGFSIEGFTNLNLSAGSAFNANIRVARTTDGSTSFAFFPTTAIEGGDVWMDTTSFTSNPQASNYGWITMAHELGHAFGLDHSHEGQVAPSATDHMAYTIMSYRSYEGGSTGGTYTNEQFGYAQTFMMYDIAAFQHIYGAGFSANSGDTTYRWSPTSGDTVINNQVAIDAGANRIFATIWDGDGNDTYDLSAYSSNLNVNLEPGQFSSFSQTQKADLGDGNDAEGNIYNALQYQGDPRSLIENAIGGTGNDTLTGNSADNTLNGGVGNDWMTPGSGSDTVIGGSGVDTVSFSNLAQAVQANLTNGSATSGGDTNTLSEIENVTGSSFADYIVGNDAVNKLRGLGGSDWMVGSAGADTFDGGSGNDMVSYVSSSSGVIVNLSSERGTGGDAQGDKYTSIERVTGSIHQDNFFGSGGIDEFRGLGGYDWFNSSGGGRDVYDGGSGQDTVSYSAAGSGVAASLSTGRGTEGDALSDVFRFIDNLTGSSYDDTLIGNGERNVLRGLYGEDTLRGGGGVDRLTGGGSDDYLDGGTGWDYAFYSGNRDQYAITTDGAVTTVEWLSGGREGTDTVVNIEVLVFADENVFL